MEKGLTKLHELALRKLKERHPVFPEHAIPVPKFSDKKPLDLAKSIFHWLSLNQYYVTRTGTWINAIVNDTHLSIDAKSENTITKDFQAFYEYYLSISKKEVK